jgi:hypothetical protein
MLEPLGMQQVEAELAGMAERGVAEVVAEGDGLGQVLVEPQADRHGPGDLRHLEHMGQAGAVMVAGRGEEDLGLVLEPPEGLGMDDPVPVALKGGAQDRREKGRHTASGGRNTKRRRPGQVRSRKQRRRYSFLPAAPPRPCCPPTRPPDRSISGLGAHPPDGRKNVEATGGLHRQWTAAGIRRGSR